MFLNLFINYSTDNCQLLVIFIIIGQLIYLIFITLCLMRTQRRSSTRKYITLTNQVLDYKNSRVGHVFSKQFSIAAKYSSAYNHSLGRVGDLGACVKYRCLRLSFFSFLHLAYRLPLDTTHFHDLYIKWRIFSQGRAMLRRACMSSVLPWRSGIGIT